MTDSRESMADSDGVISEDLRLVVIQRNPTSGSGQGAKQLRVLISTLRQSGFRVRLFADRDRFDRFVLQSEESSKIRCLVAAGGDGTVAGLANRHSQFPIATLPMGTENLMARHLQIGRCGATVARLIANGATRRFDTGVVNDQRFLLMVSVGVDADVVRRLHAARTGNIRHLSYVQPILQSFMYYTFPKLSVHSADGKLMCAGTHVIVTNVPEYGFRMPFCPAANPHDGLLDVRVFRQTGRISTVLHAIRTRLGFSDRADHVARFQVREVEVRSESSDAMAQFDGDPSGACPIRIVIAPASMTLVVRSSHGQ